MEYKCKLFLSITNNDWYVRSLITPEIKKELERTIPIKRIATPQEQADVILFLVSEMSNYVAGAAIDSNGGQF